MDISSEVSWPWMSGPKLKCEKYSILNTLQNWLISWKVILRTCYIMKWSKSVCKIIDHVIISLLTTENENVKGLFSTPLWESKSIFPHSS